MRFLNFIEIPDIPFEIVITSLYFVYSFLFWGGLFFKKNENEEE